MKIIIRPGFTILETVIFLVIATSIILVSLSAARRVLKSADASAILSEYTKYSQGIISFYQLKLRLPGDLLPSEMAGALSNTTLVNNSAKVLLGCAGSECNMGSGQVSAQKSMVAFQQMAIMEMIPSSSADPRYLIPGINACFSTASSNFGSVRGKLIPASRYSKNAAWIIGADSAIHQSKLSPKNSLIYNSNIYPGFSGKPRLILFNAVNYFSAASCEVDVNIASNGFMGSGVVPSDVAQEIDGKVDDGKPSSGIIVAENGVMGVLGCTDLNSDIVNRGYAQDSYDSGKRSCIMTFAVNLSY